MWRNGNLTEEVLEDYPERLPALLGLDPSVTRIELQEDTLDNVLLGLIQERGGAPRE